MQYDISFIMPVTDLTKYYYRRFLDLKKYAAVNCNDRPIRWKLLVGPDEDFYGNDITQGWPSNMTAEVVKTPYLEPAQKIAYYYGTLTEEEVRAARWHAKFDDDTITDVERLMFYLDDEFDHNDKIYLVTELRQEYEQCEDKLLTEMGYEHWIKNERIIHEWEGCIASQGAMLALINNPEAKRYLNKRMEVKGGYGDQPVAIALKFCKIQCINPLYLCVWAKPTRLSMFGGPFVHIHFFLGRSTGAVRCYEFTKVLLDKSHHEEMKAKVEGKKYSFSKKDCFENTHLKLRADHQMIGEKNGKTMSVGMWTTYKDKTLAMILHDFPSIVYEMEPTDDNFTEYTGICNDNKAPLRLIAL